MSKRVKNLAYAAMAAALGTSLLFLAGALPTAKLALAGLAGLLGVVIRMRCGLPWGIASFAATALLSLLLVPQKAVSVLYAAFLGYYPVIKSSLERPSSKVLRWLLKLLLFNMVFALLTVLGRAVLTSALPTGRLMLPALLLGGNAAFVIYDLALTQLILFYLRRLGGKIK
jgi:hypothetical protein